MPAPPPLLSTNTVCPSCLLSSLATVRATISDVPPGANGTTKRIAWRGHAACARASAGHAMQAAAARARRRWIVMRRLRRPELVAPQAAVDRNHGAGDVARARAGEKAHQIGDVLGLAVASHRNLVIALPLPVLRCVVAQDLLAVDAPRRDAVHRDAALAHHPAQ